MNQTAQDAMMREVLQMLARLAETRATHQHGADMKFAIDEMIQRNTGCRNVAASFGGGELDTQPFAVGVEHSARECLDALNLY